jgi:hypothetical protein
MLSTLIVAQLLQNFLRLLRNTKAHYGSLTLKIVHYSVHKIAPVNVVVGPMDPLHIIAHHLIKVHFNILFRLILSVMITAGLLCRLDGHSSRMTV